MKYLSLLVLLFLVACSTLPDAIHSAPEPNIQLRQVVNSVDTYKGRIVRWGGKIIRIEQRDGASLIEIHQFPLNRYGFPLKNRITQGRFMILTKRTMNIDELQPGLVLTVSGMIQSEEKVMDKRKVFYEPVVQADIIHLWPYKKSGDRVYTITGMESRYRLYGYGGSGYYSY